MHSSSSLNQRLSKEWTDLSDQTSFKLVRKASVSPYEMRWQCLGLHTQKNIQYNICFTVTQSQYPHSPPKVSIFDEKWQQQVQLEGYLPIVTMLNIVAILRGQMEKATQRKDIPSKIDIAQWRLTQNKKSAIRSSQTVQDQSGSHSKLNSESHKDTRSQEVSGVPLRVHAAETGVDLTIDTKTYEFPFIIRHVGIHNIGNSCFANSVLQMLFHRKLIRYLVLSSTVEPIQHRQNADNKRMLALAKVFEGLLIGKGPFKDQKVLRAIEAQFRDRREQRDAYQYLMALLGFIVESSSEGEAIKSLFEVHYKQVIKCPYHNVIEQIPRECYVLNLNGMERSTSIWDAIMSGNYGVCTKCKQRTKIYPSNFKKMDYLFVHPNWSTTPPYQYNGYQNSAYPSYGQFRPTEQTHESYEYTDQMRLEEELYVLVGAIQHFGSSQGGHYVYLHRVDKRKDEWIEYNDSKVERSRRPSGRAIILVYERQVEDEAINIKIEKSRAEPLYHMFRALAQEQSGLLQAQKQQRREGRRIDEKKIQVDQQNDNPSSNHRQRSEKPSSEQTHKQGRTMIAESGLQARNGQYNDSILSNSSARTVSTTHPAVNEQNHQAHQQTFDQKHSSEQFHPEQSSLLRDQLSSKAYPHTTDVDNKRESNKEGATHIRSP